MPGCSIFPSTSPFAWRATGSLSRSISKTLRPPSRSPGRVNTGLWDQRSSTPIETAGGLPPCSVTQHPNSLGWARPARARVAMRSDFWLALALKFQICLVSSSDVRKQCEMTATTGGSQSYVDLLTCLQAAYIAAHPDLPPGSWEQARTGINTKLIKSPQCLERHDKRQELTKTALTV